MRQIRDELHRSRLLARAQMGGAMARLFPESDPALRPLALALKAVARGRIPAEERFWIERIEARRSRLLQYEVPTGMPEFDPAGKGSAKGGFTMTAPQTTMGTASAFISLAPSWCALMMCLVREKGPRTALEVGTGFGISGSYQAAALELNGRGELTTLEGSDAWAAAAVEGFTELGLERVRSRVGPIAVTLLAEAAALAPLDFVFIDAEHQEQATLDHFDAVLPHLAAGAIVAFDDVNWAEVRSAFDAIARHEGVSSSIAIGRLGFVFVGGASPQPY